VDSSTVETAVTNRERSTVDSSTVETAVTNREHVHDFMKNLFP
jgi:hypothetical protein